MGFGDTMRMGENVAMKMDCGHPNKEPGDFCELCKEVVPGGVKITVHVDMKVLEFIKERCVHGRDQGGPAAQALQLIEQAVDRILSEQSTLGGG